MSFGLEKPPRGARALARAPPSGGIWVPKPSKKGPGTVFLGFFDGFLPAVEKGPKYGFLTVLPKILKSQDLAGAGAINLWGVRTFRPSTGPCFRCFKKLSTV